MVTPTFKLQEKLVQAGYKYLRLCDSESTIPAIKHYTLEKSKDADSAFCPDNLFVEIDSVEAEKVFDYFLNPTILHPNPFAF